ncbi:hypothetical protein SKAU_G00010450 [Synaphobranchus kaupii]|uniref:ribonuclease H n=1 Tax=Synaphobranchus kaupii TaxID=118154 RepID=A0A9Q1GBS3_SYNKA|nr:hypothetical protein SKAU_G00010450 [Synaphobranchus kaupii]
MPKFSEEDINMFFDAFEVVARECDWPEAKWPLLVQSVLKGKAQVAFAALDPRMGLEYESLKMAVLTAYGGVPEAYRQRFRTVKQRRVPRAVEIYLSEQKVSALLEAAQAADAYEVIHGGSVGLARPGGGRHDLSRGRETSAKGLPLGGKASGGQRPGMEKSHSAVVCHHCREPGHIKPRCPRLKRERDRDIICHGCRRPGHVQSQCPQGSQLESRAKVVALVASLTKRDEGIGCSGPREVPPLSYQPFTSVGTVSMAPGGEEVSITILRDTAEAQAREALTPIHEEVPFVSATSGEKEHISLAGTVFAKAVSEEGTSAVKGPGFSLSQVTDATNFSREVLIQEQNQDPLLAPLWKQAVTVEESEDMAVWEFVDQDILMRPADRPVVVPSDREREEGFLAPEPAGARLDNSRACEQLQEQLKHLLKAQDVMALVAAHPSLFRNRPGLTSLVEHDVDTGEMTPMKQHPYRLPPFKKEKVPEEVEYMLEIGAIEPGSGEWSSPVVLIPKSDVTSHLCIDYRMNAPATFQRLMNLVTSGLDNVVTYIDDVVIYSESWQSLRKLFGRLESAQLVVNHPKCKFGRSQVTYLGHLVGCGAVLPRLAKVQAIMELLTPTTRRQLMHVLGICGFYRRFVPNFAAATAPLTNLLGKDVKWNWTQAC